VVLPLLAVGVLLSGSRAALGGLVVLLVAIGPLTRSRALMGALMAGAAVVLAVFAFGIIRPEGDNALGRTFGADSGTAERSSAVRDDLGERVFARWQARPLTGNGYNYMRPSHNVYLGVIASAGVLGVIGFGTILTTVLRRAWRRRGDLVAVGVSASYVAYLGAAYFDNIFWWRWLWFYVGMVVAICATRPIPAEVGYVPPAPEADDETEPALSTR
jgi:O-antigen ligase